MKNKLEISHRIKEYYEMLGWTKAKFAIAIGEYPQHLNKVFEGKLNPLKYIGKLKELGCDVNWILTGEKAIVKEPQYGITKKYGKEKDSPTGLSLEEQVTILKENKNLTAEIASLKKRLIKLSDDCGNTEGCLAKNFKIEIEDDGPKQEK